MPDRRARRPLAVVLAAAALLGGCALPGFGGSDGGTGGGPGGGGADPDPDPTATRPTEVPSWLLECGAEDPTGTEDVDSLQLADLDLTTASWGLPDGWVETTSYHEDNPVERLVSTWYAEPTDPPVPSLNVVQVVVYADVDWGDLADACGRVPLAAVEEKLAEYREQIGAEALSEAEMTEAAGHPAIRQEIGLSRYSYTGTWLFSRDQLLHVYGQWTDPSYREVITQGYDAVLASLQVG